LRFGLVAVLRGLDPHGDQEPGPDQGRGRLQGGGRGSLSCNRYGEADEGGRACRADDELEELQGHGQGVRSAKAGRVSQELRVQAGLKSTVMRALDPGIHHLETRWVAEAKPGHDEVANVSRGDGS